MELSLERPNQQDVRSYLHGQGLRVTAVRVAVLKLLKESQSALEANEVWARLQSDGGEASAADRVTVYRTLNSFVEVGMAHRIDPGDRVFRFALTDHSRCNGKQHDHDHPHMLCNECAGLYCMQDAEVVVRARPGAKLSRSPEIRQEDVTLRGVCDECAGGGKSAKSRK